MLIFTFLPITDRDEDNKDEKSGVVLQVGFDIRKDSNAPEEDSNA